MYRLMSQWEPLDLEWQMVIYVAIFYAAFTYSAFFQFALDEKHELMLEAFKGQKNDLKDI